MLLEHALSGAERPCSKSKARNLRIFFRMVFVCSVGLLLVRQFENLSHWSAATITPDDDNQSNKPSQGLIESQPNQHFVEKNETFKTLIMNDDKCDPFNKEDTRHKATIVVMAHSLERRENYEILLSCYGQMTSVVDKVIFVWNNVGTLCPLDFSRRLDPVTIELWTAKENLLTNRFEAPRQVAKTNAIIVVDDDVLISAGLVHGMLRLWEDCKRDCVVALDQRYADPVRKVYGYGPPQRRPANLAITKTFLVNRKFLDMYMADTKLVARASAPGSVCEDISLSLAVTNYSGTVPSFVPGEWRGTPDTTKPQLFATPDGKKIGTRHDLPDPGALSSGDNFHARRSNCVDWVLNHFGAPLDSILRKIHFGKILSTQRFNEPLTKQ